MAALEKEDEPAQRDRMTFRITPEGEKALREIRDAFDYRSDAEVMRKALGVMQRMAEAKRNGEKVYVADRDRKFMQELIFIGG